MGIVVSQYNPWRETLAAQLLGMVGGKYLENQRASEASKKAGALFREYPIEGVDQETSSLNLNQRAELERQRSDMDAINLVAQMSRQGLSGASPAEEGSYLPSRSEVWAQPAAGAVPGMAPPPVTLNEMMGSNVVGITPKGTLNTSSYDPSMADRLPFSLTPEGVGGSSAITPQVQIFKMMNRLGDPRFSAYTKEILPILAQANAMYSTRREDNYKDHSALVDRITRAAQANVGARTATTPAELVAAIGSHVGPSAEIFMNENKNKMALEGAGIDADSKRDAAALSANASRDAAAISASASRYGDDTRAASSKYNSDQQLAASLANAEAQKTRNDNYMSPEQRGISNYLAGVERDANTQIAAMEKTKSKAFTFEERRALKDALVKTGMGLGGYMFDGVEWKANPNPESIQKIVSPIPKASYQPERSEVLRILSSKTGDDRQDAERAIVMNRALSAREDDVSAAMLRKYFSGIGVFDNLTMPQWIALVQDLKRRKARE